MDTLKLFALAAIILGIVATILNMRYVLRGNRKAIRFYIICKTVVAAYFAILYALVFVEVIPPGMTSPWLRPSAAVLLLFLVLDAVIRRDFYND